MLSLILPLSVQVQSRMLPERGLPIDAVNAVVVDRGLDSNLLLGWTSTGPAVERACWSAPQCFGEEFFVCRRDSAGTHVSRRLRVFVRRLVVAEPSLHVDAVNGIVNAVLNVSEVAHELLPTWSHC